MPKVLIRSLTVI